jgi:hypothetical protein
VCPKLSNQQIDIGTARKACFELSTTRDDFEGALLFKLQNTSHDQSHMNAIHVYILTAWKVKDAKPLVRVALIEHTDAFAWNESELKKLYYENCGRLEEYDDTISETWLMNDSMALKTTFRIRDLNGSFEQSISISEEERNEDAMRPLCVDPER